MELPSAVAALIWTGVAILWLIGAAFLVALIRIIRDKR